MTKIKNHPERYRDTIITGVNNWIGGCVQVDPTNINVGAGDGFIVDSTTNPLAITRTPVVWSNTSISVTMPTAFGVQHFYVDSSGTVQQQSTRLTRSELRSKILLCSVAHVNGAITSIVEGPKMQQSIGTLLQDLIDYIPDGAKLKGALVLPVDALLSVYRDSGTFFREGGAALSSPLDANVISVPSDGDSSTALEFAVVLQDSSIDATGVTVMPKEYNPSGNTVTGLVGQRAVIHYLFVLGGVNFLLMGQSFYSNVQDAVASASADLNNVSVPDGLGEAILLAQIIVGNQASNFADPALAQILNIQSGGEVGNGSEKTHDSITLAFPDGGVGTYNIGAGEIAGGEIVGVIVVTDSGEIDFDLFINATQVGGVSGVTIDDTQQEHAATTDKTFTRLDQLSVVLSNDVASTAPRVTIEIKPE